MSKIKLKALLETINKAPTGGFVGITDYESENGDVVSVTGRIGCSYGDMRALAIEELEKAIAEDDFESLIVEGSCYYDESEGWNARKRSFELKEYDEHNGGYFPAAIVKSLAMQILEDWKNPKERKSNGVNLSEKESGLVFNKETGTFNFTLLVDHETLKESGEAKKETKSAPETKIKKLIRQRFERKIKSYTIREGKFKQLSIAGEKYKSTEITF